MSHVPHELTEEFPEFTDKIHGLKMQNAHFAKLFDQYHEVNRSIHRYEMNIEPTGDTYLETMRKQRMKLKDEIYGMLRD